MDPLNLHSKDSRALSMKIAITFWVPSLCFPDGASAKDPPCQCRRRKRCRFDPWVGKIPWRRAWQPTPVFLPGESHGQRSPAGYSPQGCKESDTTEWLSTICPGCARCSAPLTVVYWYFSQICCRVDVLILISQNQVMGHWEVAEPETWLLCAFLAGSCWEDKETLS